MDVGNAAGGVYRELYETQFRQVIESEQAPGSKEATLDIQALATSYDVRPITDDNLGDVFWLMRSNRRYYRELGESPSMGWLTTVVGKTPEGADPNNRHFVGFFGEDGGLIAVMDLICGYPQDDMARIDWFLVAADKQGQGVGSGIFADVRAAMTAQGYTQLELTIPERAEQGIAFWQAQGFSLTGERDGSGRYPVVTLARSI